MLKKHYLSCTERKREKEKVRKREREREREKERERERKKESTKNGPFSSSVITPSKSDRQTYHF